MPARLPRDAGFSLVEILVAVSIIGVLSAAIVLALQPGQDPVEDEAQRLTARLVYASQEAIASGQPVGLQVENFGEGYSFQRYVDGRWRPLRDNPALSRHALEGSVRLEIVEAMFRPDPDSDASAPQIPAFWFDPAGLTDPFTLRLEDAGQILELTWDDREPGRWVEVAG